MCFVGRSSQTSDFCSDCQWNRNQQNLLIENVFLISENNSYKGMYTDFKTPFFFKKKKVELSLGLFHIRFLPTIKIQWKIFLILKRLGHLQKVILFSNVVHHKCNIFYMKLVQYNECLISIVDTDGTWASVAIVLTKHPGDNSYSIHNNQIFDILSF